jgi:hypothetical protein
MSKAATVEIEKTDNSCQVTYICASDRAAHAAVIRKSL